MAIEPFHPGFPDWNPGEKKYSDLITNETTMNSALDELFDKYTAIKVLDYQFEKEIYEVMLKRTDLKILFLTRKSLVAMALSSRVAEQTKEYQKTNKTHLYENLEPVDIGKMEKEIEYIGRTNSYYRRFLDEHRSNDHLDLCYEDLYSEDLEQNKNTLKPICDFLGISMPSDEAIKKHMTPSEAKINYGDIYKKIPNYAEISERFGEV